MIVRLTHYSIGFMLPVVAIALVGVMLHLPKVRSELEYNSVSDDTVADQSDTALTRPTVEIKGPHRIASRYAIHLINDRNQESTNNPFFYTPPPSNQMRAAQDKVGERENDETGASEFRLTGVMGGRRPVAVINQSLYVVGQEVAPGWTLKRINIGTRVAVIEGPDSTEYVLKPIE